MVLFLGAGASKPFGKLLMKEFVSEIKQHPASLETLPLLEAICDEKEDLEFLFEQLMEIQLMRYLAEELSHPLAVLPATVGSAINPVVREVKWPDIGKLSSEAGRLIDWLKSEVFLHYRTLENGKRGFLILSAIIYALKTSNHPLVIFTTNYDPAVEELCAGQDGWDLVDGFRASRRDGPYVWQRNVFDDFVYEPSLGSGLSGKVCLVLFKLHGSTTWISQEKQIIKTIPMYARDDPAHKNVLIFPATRKIAIDDPFFTGYDYLGKCLERARLCVVVGYSFRDYDTLSRFKSAQIANPNLKIAVVDPNARSLVKQLAADYGIAAESIPYALGIQDAEYLSKITNLMTELSPNPH